MIEVTPQDVALYAPEFKAMANDFGESTEETLDIQFVTFDNEPDSGELELSFDSQSFTIAFDDNLEDINMAVQALPGLDDAVVTGNFEVGFTFDFSEVEDVVLLQIESNTLEADSEPVVVTIENQEEFVDPASRHEIMKSMIELARQFVCEEKWSLKALQAIAIMTAHLLTEMGYGDGSTGSATSGPVTMEKVGDLQRSYAALSSNNFSVSEQLLATTKYGRLFLALRKTIPVTPLVT